MYAMKFLAILALPAFACTGDNLGGSGPAAAPGEPAAQARPLGETLAASACTDDYFHCFDAAECTPPALSDSTSCLIGRDYDIDVTERTSEVIVLSIAGGLIEVNTTEVADKLAERFSWSRYDFSGHGTDACLAGMSNSERLHITATRFNDPLAVGLVGRYSKAVAIYGYGASAGYRRGTILVGGSNAAQVTEFISYLNLHKGSFPLYDLQPVATLSRTASSCEWIAPNAPRNIVNRVAGGEGGLQLQFDSATRANLVNPSPQYDALRTVIYDSIGSAMNQ